MDDIFEAARAALRALGPLSGERLLDAVGVDPSDPDAVDELLEAATEEGIWTLGLDLYLLAEHVLRGTRCTQVVTAEEVAGDRLRIEADLPLEIWAAEEDEPAGEVVVEHVGREPFLVGPPGWLSGFAPGTLLAVGWREGWFVEPVPDAAVVEPGDLPARLRRSYEESAAPDGVAMLHELFGRVAIAEDRPFAELRPPLGILLEAAGLEVRGEEVAEAGFDWEGRVARRRERTVDELAARHGLTRAQAALLHGLGVARPMNVVEALADRAVATAYVEEHLEGPFGAIGARFGSSVLEEVLATEDPPPGAHLVSARVAEHEGDLGGFVAGVAAALAGDGDLRPAHWDAAFLASWRGDAATAIDHRRRAGATREDEPSALLRRFAAPPPGVSRNAPCPCGSGRKTKLCCLGEMAHPLAHRAHWLHEKLADALDRSALQLPVLEFAADLVGAGSWEEPAAVLALGQRSFWTIALFEADLLEPVLERYGSLLPADELVVADAWRHVRHRLVTLEDVLPGAGLRIHDVASGERFEVLARLEPGSWNLQEDAVALLAPVDDRYVLLGEPIATPASLRGELQAAIEAGGSAALVRVAFRFLLVAEILVLEQRRNERIAFALPGVDPADVDVDDEDELQELVEEWHGPMHDPEVAAELHLLLHAIVATRVIADDPPQLWDEAQRLLRRGHERHDVLHHLMRDVSDELYRAMR